MSERDPAFASLAARVDALLARGAADLDHPADLAARDALARDLFAWQRTRNPPVARLAEVFLGDREPATLDDIPGVPTEVFKVARVACFPPEATVRVFHTSGTTQDLRGSHAFADLGRYTAGALAAAARWLLPAPRYRSVFIAQDEASAPDSSLTFMLARFAERWSPGQPRPFYLDGAVLDSARALHDLCSVPRELPVALLGTTYGFVHLADAMAAMGTPRVVLPPGSVAMPTGGSKGRSRELSPGELDALLAERFGLARTDIVGEYGMTELSSQTYEAHREGAPPGRYRAPPWLVVTAVDPESLRPVPPGALGLLRLVDLVNVGSAIAVQTSDLGRVHPDGFEVLGRAPGATPRGCARALDALLAP